MRFTILLCTFLLSIINSYGQKNKLYHLSKKENDTNKTNVLPEVNISGSILKRLKISKNGLEEMNIPQSMCLINTNQIQQQQITNITDILKNVPGMYIMGNTGGYQEEIASRGYNISSTNTFKNGIRFFNGMKIEMSGIEKIEILKGNTAIDYGNVTPGGLLNIITKKPNFKKGNTIQISYASFEQIKPQIDIWGTLHKKIAYRINGSYQQVNSFRNYVNSNTYYLNPSLLFNLNKKSSILLEGDYTQYITVPDFGAGIINYQIVQVPISRFTGVSWGKYIAYQSFIAAKYNYLINKKWSITALIGIRNYNTSLFSNTRPNSAGGIIDNGGNWNRSLQKSTIADNYNIKQIDANTDFNIGSINNKMLIGADFEQFTTNTPNYINYTNYDKLNIFNDYIASNEPRIPYMTKNTLTTNYVDRMGIYLQDLISLKKYIKFFVGLRYNYIKSTTNVYTYSTASN
ncbi:MAG: TonB-dependent receptor, partial [Sediminibacterium sp.]|nr:TonB-dependent receptor [Sediminibacterium sp.]